MVTSIYKFSPEEQAFLRRRATMSAREYHELQFHFREGHWRRPQGLGHDPFAEKTVHVRPTVVRPDKRVPGTLAGGAEKRL
jgi:hypothetical protein